MNIIYSTVLGSKAYKLDGPDSDEDIRGIFLNDSVDTIIGLNKHESQVCSKDEDSQYWELRHFLKLLAAGNFNAVELLYSIKDDDDWNHPVVQYLYEHRDNLVNKEKLHASICGYAQSEWKRAIGETTGKLGEKRKKLIEQYGFDPKSVVNALKIMEVGYHYLKTGIFEFDLDKINEGFTTSLRLVKFEPCNLGFELYVKPYWDICEKRIRELAVDNHIIDPSKLKVTRFRPHLYDNICLKAYMSTLVEKCLDLKAWKC